MKIQLPLLNCNLLKTEQLMGLMLDHGLKINKNGRSSIAGDGFAQALAKFLGCRYVNNKAPFDVICELFNKPIGIEVKLASHPINSGFLRIELANGTSNAWHYISKITNINGWHQLSKENVNDVGNSYLNFLWSRWNNFKIDDIEIDLQNSLFVVGQKYIEDKHELCTIYTLPLNTLPRNLSWSIQGENISGIDESGRKIIEWYGHHNGLCKFFPLISEKLYSSSPFRVRTEAIDEINKYSTCKDIPKYLNFLKSVSASKELQRQAFINLVKNNSQEFLNIAFKHYGV